jgi:competence protein ComEA
MRWPIRLVLILLSLTCLWVGQDRVPVMPLVAEESHRVDLNRADAIELALLPGLGPILAARIVQDRMRQGCFDELADLTRVGGIGPRTIERLQPFVTLTKG